MRPPSLLGTATEGVGSPWLTMQPASAALSDAEPPADPAAVLQPAADVEAT